LNYSDIDTPVKIQIVNNSHFLTFSFQDHGIGIPADDIDNLFEPFHLGNNVGQIPGTGLGLAILKKAIELHGGQISVESQLGKGSKFSVKLPLNQPQMPRKHHQ
jgi:signal transduction histidine kinase